MSLTKLRTKHTIFSFRGGNKTRITITLCKGSFGGCPAMNTVYPVFVAEHYFMPYQVVQVDQNVSCFNVVVYRLSMLRLHFMQV
jgi:hypothetical protein